MNSQSLVDAADQLAACQKATAGQSLALANLCEAIRRAAIKNDLDDTVMIAAMKHAADAWTANMNLLLSLQELHQVAVDNLSESQKTVALSGGSKDDP